MPAFPLPQKYESQHRRCTHTDVRLRWCQHMFTRCLSCPLGRSRCFLLLWQTQIGRNVLFITHTHTHTENLASNLTELWRRSAAVALFTLPMTRLNYSSRSQLSAHLSTHPGARRQARLPARSTHARLPSAPSFPRFRLSSYLLCSHFCLLFSPTTSPLIQLGLKTHLSACFGYESAVSRRGHTQEMDVFQSSFQSRYVQYENTWVTLQRMSFLSRDTSFTNMAWIRLLANNVMRPHVPMVSNIFCDLLSCVVSTHTQANNGGGD